MSISVTHTWGRLDGKPTISIALRDRLGREPTHRELVAAVKRMLQEVRK